MGRLLLLVAIVWIALLLYRSLRRPAVVSRPKERAVESMVRCATCGVHLPRSEAFTTGNRFFCSRSHAGR